MDRNKKTLSCLIEKQLKEDNLMNVMGSRVKTIRAGIGHIERREGCQMCHAASKIAIAHPSRKNKQR